MRELPQFYPITRVILFLIGLVVLQMMAFPVLSTGLLASIGVGFSLMILQVAGFAHWLDRRSFTSLGVEPNPQGARHLMAGLLIGGGMVALNLLVLGALGYVSQVRLADGFSLLLLVWFGAFLIQGSGEELMQRGYILQNLLSGYHRALAVMLQAVLFMVLHLGNPGITALGILNLVIFGVATAFAYLRLGTLWLVFGIHAGWNFTLSNLAGLTVSGIEVPTRFLHTTLRGPELWTGGSFGLEASVVNTTVWLGFCLVFALMPRRYSGPVWWEQVRTLTREKFAGVVVEEVVAERSET